MLKIGSPILDPYGKRGAVERNSVATGAHMVRITDLWFLVSDCKPLEE